MNERNGAGHYLAACFLGLFAGGAVGAAVVHIPLFFFPGRGDEIGPIVWAGFMTAPIGALVGAIVAVHFLRQRGLDVVARTSALSFGGSIAVMALASIVATAHPLSAFSCQNGPHQATLASNALAEIFPRDCLTGRSTLEASVTPSGQKRHYDDPGNAVILDVSRQTAQNPITMRVMGGPDSVMAFAYDDRARVIFVAQRIGNIAIRAVPQSTAQMAAGTSWHAPAPANGVEMVERTPPSTVAPVENTPSVATTADSGFDYVDSIPAKTADGCAIEGRGVYIASPYKFTMHKRTCPGERPTLEATLMVRPGRMDFESRGNALIVDASADSVGHPVRIDVIKSTPAYVQLAVDRRAKVIFAAKSVEHVGIRVLGGKAR